MITWFKKSWDWFWQPVEPLGNLPQGCLTVLGPFAGLLFILWMLFASAWSWITGGSP